MVQQGILKRVGRGKFMLGESKEYKPEISPKLKSLYNKLKKEFPYVNMCMWNTSIINEFMIHQPAKFYNIIEVEKDATDSVFYFLKNLNQNAFISPTKEILERYIPESKAIFLIVPLVSEAPVQTINGVETITLEKMLVDIHSNDLIFSAQQGSEKRTIFNEALSKYTISQSKMLRYANRRRQKKSFSNFLNQLQIYGSN
jgi:hypothetical protein